jgi:hypothetical protein
MVPPAVDPSLDRMALLNMICPQLSAGRERAIRSYCHLPLSLVTLATL